MTTQRILWQAIAFHDATRALAPTAPPNDPMRLRQMVVHVANAGFCIELYLKALLSIEKNESVRGHELDKLYASLSVETKQKLEEGWSKSITPGRLKLAELAGKRVGTLAEALKESANVFIAYRYAHEAGPDKPLPDFDLGPVPSLLRTAIQEMAPGLDAD